MNILYDTAISFLNIPYKWGGGNPISGFDCSGLVIEILKSCGMAPTEDMTAQSLFIYLSKKSEPNKYQLGSIAFFGPSPNRIIHCGFCVDKYRMIEAGGGDPNTHTITDAVKKNAVVRIRPIASRGDLVGTLLPKYNVD